MKILKGLSRYKKRSTAPPIKLPKTKKYTEEFDNQEMREHIKAVKEEDRLELEEQREKHKDYTPDDLEEFKA